MSFADSTLWKRIVNHKVGYVRQGWIMNTAVLLIKLEKIADVAYKFEDLDCPYLYLVNVNNEETSYVGTAMFQLLQGMLKDENVTKAPAVVERISGNVKNVSKSEWSPSGFTKYLEKSSNDLNEIMKKNNKKK